MPSVVWSYPERPTARAPIAPTTPAIPPTAHRNHRYALDGDRPAWRPVAVYDDGRRVYVEFPRGIVQGEMPPLFVIGSAGQPALVKTRVHQNIPIVDRLVGAAEVRLGGQNKERLRQTRTHGQAAEWGNDRCGKERGMS